MTSTPIEINKLSPRFNWGGAQFRCGGCIIINDWSCMTYSFIMKDVKTLKCGIDQADWKRQRKENPTLYRS